MLRETGEWHEVDGEGLCRFRVVRFWVRAGWVTMGKVSCRLDCCNGFESWSYIARYGLSSITWCLYWVKYFVTVKDWESVLLGSAMKERGSRYIFIHFHPLFIVLCFTPANKLPGN